MTIGTLISSLLVGPFSSRFGRKAGLWAASLLNFIATAIMLGSTSLGALYFARLLLGKLPRAIHSGLFYRLHLKRHICRLVPHLLTTLRARGSASPPSRDHVRRVLEPAVHRLDRGRVCRLRDTRHGQPTIVPDPSRRLLRRPDDPVNRAVLLPRLATLARGPGQGGRGRGGAAQSPEFGHQGDGAPGRVQRDQGIHAGTGRAEQEGLVPGDVARY
jgi:hypothetical protein